MPKKKVKKKKESERGEKNIKASNVRKEKRGV